MNLRIRLSAATPVNIVAYICIILTFTPMMRQHYLPYLVGAFLLFFVLSLPKYIHCLSHNLVMQLASIYFLIEILYRIFGFSDAGIGNYAYRVMRLIVIWMFFYFVYYSDETAKKNAFYAVLISLGVNLLYNITSWMNSATSLELAYRYSDTTYWNVGRTDFQYCIAIMALILLSYWFTQSDFQCKKINKAVLWSLLILSGIYLIFYAQSTTMLLTTLFAVGVIFIFRKQRTKSQIFVRFILLLFFIIGAILCFDRILQWLINVAEFLGREKTVSRLIAMQQISNTGFSPAGAETGSMARIEMIGIDIKCWTNSVFSFFFGRGYHFKDYGNIISSALNNFSGNHSTLFDILARYGLVGITVYVGIIRNIRINLVNSAVSDRSKVFIIILWGYVLFNMIMNDVGMHNIILLLVFLTDYLLTDKKSIDTIEAEEAGV